MKKTIAVLAFAGVAVGACRRAGSDEAFQWVSELPAGTVIHLWNGAGSVEVNRAGGQTANITGSRHWKRGRSRDINFVVTQRGDEYYICAMWRNSGKCGGTYRGKNTGGILSMLSLFNRKTDATADFEATLPANVVLDVRNTNGDVSIDGITGGVTAKTVNGDIDAENVGGKLSLSTTNGSLEVSAAPDASLLGVLLNTTNGEIRAELPGSVEGAFDLSTVNGEVSSDFALESATTSQHNKAPRQLRGRIGSADQTIKMRTINGSVTVTRAGAHTSHVQQR